MGMSDRLVIADDASDGGYGSEDGEELQNVDEDRRRALSLDTREGPADSESRLSIEYVCAPSTLHIRHAANSWPALSRASWMTAKMRRTIG